MKGVQLNCNILPSRGNIVTSPTYLILVGWKDLSVSYGMFCLSFEKFVCLSRVVSACFIGKFCLSVLSGMFVSLVYSWS